MPLIDFDSSNVVDEEIWDVTDDVWTTYDMIERANIRDHSKYGSNVFSYLVTLVKVANTWFT